MKLHIADNFSIPSDAITQALAFIGRRGSGKSYASTKLAEEFYRIGAQFVAIDPVGIWYGLRLSANQKGAGLDIVIFGGLHGDIPIEPTGGSLIADVIIDRGLTAILDVSQFESDMDKARFITSFADRFFFRKKASPSAIHIFLEEAQEFIPQNTQKGEEKMLHNWVRIIKLGRNFGIGISIISQRPQEINKKALNQTECLFAFQLTGTHERKAIKEWISEKGLHGNLDEILPHLKQGHCHVWSPVWLETNNEIHISEKKTYSAGTTPKIGERIITKPLAPVELEKLREDMKATLQKAKENDPNELKKENAKLKKELALKPKAEFSQEDIKKEAEKIAANAMRENKKHFLLIAKTLRNFHTSFKATLETGLAKLEQVPELLSSFESHNEIKIPLPEARVQKFTPKQISPKISTNGESKVGNGGLRKILIALAQNPNGLSDGQIGTRTGLSSRSGSFSTWLGTARSQGWITGQRSSLQITDEGLSSLGEFELLPEGNDLYNYWCNKLGSGGASKIFQAIHGAGTISDEEIGQQTGLSHTSGSFSTWLGTLRSLELISGKRDALTCSESLFD